MVGYNVQVAVETEHHLIVAHEVTNVGSDRSQLAAMAKEAKAVLRAERLDAVADRGYFNSEEILACEQAGITVTLPKPMTSGAKAEGRFGKQDFVYQPEQDVYRCPAGETLKYRYTNVENGLTLRRYWTTACPGCPISAIARQPKSAGSRAGSMSLFLMPCSGGSTRTRRPCASGARRSSTPSRRSRRAWERCTS